MEIVDQYIPEFSNYLLSKVPINFDNYFIFINEENIYTSANPLISMLIAFYLKNNTNVILIGIQESLNHYASITKKFGLNIINNEKFSFVDLFYSPVKSYIKEELPLSESFPYTYNTNRSKFFYSDTKINNECEIDLKTLIVIIENQLKKFNPLLKTIVIFDNISLLPNSGESLKDGLNLILKSSSDNVCINFNLKRIII